MFEHRYREGKPHGVPDFPFHIYKVVHPPGVHTILPIHWHNEMEIIYLDRGSAAFKIENREYTVREGEALIVHPGELHSGFNDQRDGICYFSIVFKFSWLSSHPSDRIEELFLAPIIKGNMRLPTLLSVKSGTQLELLNHVRQILLQYEHQLPAYEMSLKGIMLLLVADIYRFSLLEHHRVPDKHPVRESNRQIKKVLAYMEEHSRDKLDLDQLAAVMSLSRSHFCTFFKSQTGLRPMEYLNYLRVNNAAKLLRSGTCNILEASLDSGFQHASYFAKWFKYYMKMTPSEYKAHYSSDI
ncbi:helix-turn-helix transcriptional regulator [Paenibacillus aceris]|uniref:AraC-like DNA-binding protein n=1 Tax=Paenibacillus aceris TaxID=869555 RepID=A0ABS4I6J3_9BACL|nr:helix-turn-helix domain-containing protein [Paenibacillus aceris]MBP1966146.1 AraC-like DNA-binding protein [Paenibacillus aceris]NHW33303.1 AraC family transcriptional regulator [Paenibacillus aceris]